MERDVASVYVPQYSFSINSFAHETNIIIGWSTSSCQLFHSIGITSIPSFLGVQSVPLVCSMKIQFMANFSSSFVLITSDPIKFKFSNGISLSLSLSKRYISRIHIFFDKYFLEEKRELRSFLLARLQNTEIELKKNT